MEEKTKVVKVIIYDNDYSKKLFDFSFLKKREQEDEIFLKKLGERISTIRKGKNITQVSLSYACDIEKTNMRRIEAGNTNPTILMLKKICKALGISLSELLDF